MTDAVTLKANVGSGTDTVATELIGGKHYPITKLYLGASGADGGPVTTGNPIPVAIQGSLGSVTVSNFPATQTVSGTVSITGTVPVSGTFWQATQPVSLTALPALATGSNVIGGVTQSGVWNVGVTGSVAVTGTFWQATQPVSIASSVAVTGPLTDAQLRATAVPISGTVTANAGSGTFAVSGPLTDAQLRASAVPVSLASLPALATGSNAIGSITNSAFGISGTLPAFAATPTFNIGTIAGIATETTLAALNTKTPALGQSVMAASQPVVIASNQSEIPVSIVDVSATGNITTQNLVPAGAATANSAVELVLSGRSGVSIQVTGTYTGALSLQGTLDGTNWVTFGGTPLLNVNTGATAANIASATQGIFQAEASAFTRIRVTALAAVTGTATVTIRGTEAPSMFALDAALPAGANTTGGVNATQTGTWTVQPGNTANTTAWLANPSQPAGVTVEASSAKTATGNGATQTNASGRGAHFFINVSASSGTTPTLTVAVQVQDPVSTNWVQIPGAITATITGNGITLLSIIPGIVETANSKISNALPRTYRLAWTVGGTTPSFTFSVGAQYIV